MSTATISIEVDSETARAFALAPDEEKRKIQILLDLRLRELTTPPGKSLKDIMNEIGANAEARGLTPEILESLLHE
jgi:hypothetical protein